MKSAAKQAKTIFPWMSHRSSILQRLFPLKQGAEGKVRLRENIADLILCSQRSYVAQCWNFSLALKEQQTQKYLDSKEQEDHFDLRIKQCLLAKKQMSENLLDASINDIPAGLVYDFYRAFEAICSIKRDRSLPSDETDSWLILIAATLQRHIPNQQILFNALLRDLILYAYLSENPKDPQLLLMMNRLQNPTKIKLAQKAKWDYKQFCNIPLNGIVQQSLLKTTQEFDDFALDDHIFSFLFNHQSTLNHALNLVSITMEKPYWNHKEEPPQLGHVLWHKSDYIHPEQAIQGFILWLENTINTTDKDDILEFVEGMISSGSLYELGEVMKFWANFPEDKLKALLDYLKKTDQEDNKNHILRVKQILNNAALKQKIIHTHFSILDYINAILYLRNSAIAGIMPFAEIEAQIRSYAGLILRDIKSWDSFFEQLSTVSFFWRIGSDDSFLRINAWYDYIRKEPTAIFTAVPLEKLQAQKNTPSEQVKNLLTRKAVISMHKEYYQPSTKLWAINVSAPINGVRTSFLTKDIAPYSLRSENVMFLRYTLGINTQDDLLQNLFWLQEEGYRQMLKNVVSEFGGYSAEDMDQEIITATHMAGIPKGELNLRINQLTMLRDNIESIMQCQFWALDIVRYSTLVQRGLLAELIDADEADYMLHDAACAYQQKYDNWNDAVWDFYRAWLFSTGTTITSSDARTRRHFVEGLTNPLHPLSVVYQNIPWDLPLGMPRNEIFSESIEGSSSPFTSNTPRTIN